MSEKSSKAYLNYQTRRQNLFPGCYVALFANTEERIEEAINCFKEAGDYDKREKEIKQEINSQLKEQSIAYKDKVDKYEKNIKNLTLENENLKEKIVDLESNIQSAELLFQNEKTKIEELFNVF